MGYMYEGETLKDVYGDYDELNDGVKIVCGDYCAELDYVVNDGVRTYVVSLSKYETPAHVLEEEPLIMTRLFAVRCDTYDDAFKAVTQLMRYYDDDTPLDHIEANMYLMFGLHSCE